ncbi:MAG TPA: autotransporter outer membrane beta-barrel domain-containing protein, partial [Xanthobacteraceae bacterium]
MTPWTINQGTLAVSSDGNLGAASGGISFGGGTLQFQSGFTTNRSITLNAGGGTIDADGNNNIVLSGVIADGAGVHGNLTITDSLNSGGVVTLTNTDRYSGTTTINSGATLALSGSGSISDSSIVTANGIFDISSLHTTTATITTLSGTGTVALGNQTLTLSNASGTFGGSITDGGINGGIHGSLAITAGTEVLTGTSSYTGTTAINGGTLEIDGSIATSSLTSINATGLLDGTGTLGNTSVSGGVFAPGNGTAGSTQTVNGVLGFSSGGIYRVFLNPTSSSMSTVTGTATLTGGTVNAQFAAGSYVKHDYEILAAAALVGTFNPIVIGTPPAGFSASLDYTHTTNEVFLDLTSALSGATGLNGNQQNVANGLDNFFNNGGVLPPNFASIFGLTGPQLSQALSQLDGEAATGAEHGAFQLMTDFLDLMLDPWTGGSGGIGGGGATGFAPEQQSNLPPDVALAYARALKQPAPSQQQPQNFEQRWSAWGSGFGGSSTAEGNAAVGSNTVTASTYGYAAGMDYHVTPNTVYGFALAGGGTNWSLAQNLGTGRSDAFQAGVHGTTQFGPAYVSAALAFANHWFTTNRIAPVGDELRAKFEGQSYAARVEAGYRYAVLPLVGVTPYAALQAQDFHTPSYSETDLSGGGFGLSYNAMNATDTRSELGARFDDLTMFGAMPLVLRARLAWAHDWVSNPSLGAVFQALPGSNFTVNGAAVPHDSALTTAAAELHLNANWTMMAKFDGEFASTSQIYAGTGTLRYSW